MLDTIILNIYNCTCVSSIPFNLLCFLNILENVIYCLSMGMMLDSMILTEISEYKFEAYNLIL